MQDLIDRGFFDAPPGEIRVRLRVVEGRVELVIHGLDQRRVHEFVVPFPSEDVAAELCG